MALDIKAIARQGAAVGYGVAGQILKSGTLRVNSGGGTYDPATDTRTGGSTDYQLDKKGLYYRTKEQQVVDSAARTAMIMFQKADLEAAGLAGVPTQADEWIMDGITWGIDSAETDPADAVVICAIRR